MQIACGRAHRLVALVPPPGDFPMDPDILSTDDVSRLLKQDAAHVLQLFQEGVLPGRRIGAEWYTSRRQLVAFIEGGPEAEAPPPPTAKPLPARPANTWMCDACNTLNDPETVACRVCREPRNTPLMNYFPKDR